MNAIKGFQGEYRFLSNFWPCDIEHDNVWYVSVEHAYQAAKTLDIKEREFIRTQPTAGISRDALLVDNKAKKAKVKEKVLNP